MKIIKIIGMQCEHCRKSVIEALAEIVGVTKVEVNLEEGTATMEMTREVSNEEIKGVIEEIGFEIG